MAIKEKTLSLFNESSADSVRALKTICEAEKILQQAYEGRYFFELIQNVRDANKEALQDGDIYIELRDNILSVSNTGAPFSEHGIASITSIGQSPKQSLDFIGYKGIGFKSTLEVSDTPRIITTEGSVYFDRGLTVEALEKKGKRLSEDEVPLFFFPHYKKRKLTTEEKNREIVTKIELPIKENLNEDQIWEDFNNIRVSQLVLLGNIKKLEFQTPNHRILYNIRKYSQRNLLEVDNGGKVLNRFRYYVPEQKILIPNSVLHSLTGKEREIYHEGTAIDINIVLEIDEQKQFIPIEDSKLYLFYPLDIRSGFRFMIHSYFLVNPERTRLRNSPLNKYLLRKIGEYIGGEMLQSLKKRKYDTNEILYFNRNKDADLDELYAGLVVTLESKKFIYDTHSGKYYNPSQIIIANGCDQGLFPDNLLDNKPILYIENSDTFDWLLEEFHINYLEDRDISDHIEKECKKQAKLRNIAFFQNLYKYIDVHEELDVSSKKILLTSNWKLVSDQDGVFYGGWRSPVDLSMNIQRFIHFIHPDIKLDVRETRIGVTEYTSHELIRRLLKLFNEPAVPKSHILNAIYSLAPSDTKSEWEIKEKILLPVKRKRKWLSPYKNPIYFETDELRELYPDGNFIDDSVLTAHVEEDYSSEDFLSMCGVWKIPAFYISDTIQYVGSGSVKRIKHLRNLTNLWDYPFSIVNDRMLHLPVKYTKWFTDTILENWEHYKSLMTSEFLPKLRYSNAKSSQHTAIPRNVMIFSSFCERLCEERWIVLSDGESGYLPREVVGGRVGDISKVHNKVLQKYLTIFPMDYENNMDFAQSISLCHLDGNTVENFSRLLNHIYYLYQDKIPSEKDFIDFYNRVLSKVFEFYDKNELSERDLSNIFDTQVLSVNEALGRLRWERPENVYYIDDRSNYDRLSGAIKARIQPHFTKSDRNTFGRIAAKIGKRFSDSLTRKLVQKPATKKILLTNYFPDLPQVIALLEYNCETAFSSELDTLRRVEVYKKQKIQTEIFIDGDLVMVDYADYFIQKSGKSYLVHLSDNSVLEKSTLLADSLTDLMRTILNRDLKRFNVELNRFIKLNDKKGYLSDYYISSERISEIREILYISELNQQQKFWESVYNIKNILDFDKALYEDTVDCGKIALATGLELDTVTKINRDINFNDINNSKNIPLLSFLLSTLNISPDQMNKNIYPEINFSPYYQKLLDREKNKFETKFAFMLYRVLAKGSMTEQATYQDWLYKYANNCDISPSKNVINLDPKVFFVDSMKKFCPLLDLTVKDLNTQILFDPVSMYKDRRKKFISLLSEIRYNSDELDHFLGNIKTRSILYFGHEEYLVIEFKKWLDRQRKANREETVTLTPERTVLKYANQRKHEIEVIKPSCTTGIAQEKKRITAGNRINTYDGQKNYQQKQIIGMVAEMIVYETLIEKENIAIVRWVSKYAARIDQSHPGHNPNGTDGLGYDIEYIDKRGNKHYVEVKGKSDAVNCFEITSQEIKKSQQEKEQYSIILVTNVFNEKSRRIKNLGNPFIFDEGESFFENKRFSAMTKSYEIRFEE